MNRLSLLRKAIRIKTCAILIFPPAMSAQIGRVRVNSGPVGLVFPKPGFSFSAEQVEERARTAPDGTRSTEIKISQICRDSAGRMRIDWGERGPDGAFPIVYLIDPIARSIMVVLMESREAQYFVGPHSGSGPFDIGFPAPGEALPQGKWLSHKEALGARVMNGIEVEGEKIVQTSADDPKLIFTRETWSSRSVGLTLVEEASCPHWKHTARLRNVDRHEPDPSLFLIPSGFSVRDP